MDIMNAKRLSEKYVSIEKMIGLADESMKGWGVI